MSWNSGYRIIEKNVIDVYNEGLLTAKLLDILMNPYKGKDCDSGGSEDIKSKDGLSAERIICKIMKPDKYKEIVSGKKDDWDWNNDDAAYDLFSSIWRDMWGIW